MPFSCKWNAFVRDWTASLEGGTVRKDAEEALARRIAWMLPDSVLTWAVIRMAAWYTVKHDQTICPSDVHVMPMIKAYGDRNVRDGNLQISTQSS